MELKNRGGFSLRFVPISIIWTFIFSLLGIIDSGGGLPTWEDFLKLDTLFVLSAPIAFAFLFYFFYSRFNKWLVFLLAPILGVAFGVLEMTVSKTDPAAGGKLINEIFFLVVIWAVILIPPYFLTRISQRSANACRIVFVLLALLLAIQILRIA